MSARLGRRVNPSCSLLPAPAPSPSSPPVPLSEMRRGGTHVDRHRSVLLPAPRSLLPQLLPSCLDSGPGVAKQPHSCCVTPVTFLLVAGPSGPILCGYIQRSSRGSGRVPLSGERPAGRLRQF